MNFFPFFGAPCCERMMPWLLPSSFEKFQPLTIVANNYQASLLVCAGKISHKQAPLLQNIYIDMTKPSKVLYLRGCEKFISDYASIRDLSQFLQIDVEIKNCPISDNDVEEAIRFVGRSR